MGRGTGIEQKAIQNLAKQNPPPPSVLDTQKHVGEMLASY